MIVIVNCIRHKKHIVNYTAEWCHTLCYNYKLDMSYHNVNWLLYNVYIVQAILHHLHNNNTTGLTIGTGLVCVDSDCHLVLMFEASLDFSLASDAFMCSSETCWSSTFNPHSCMTWHVCLLQRASLVTELTDSPIDCCHFVSFPVAVVKKTKEKMYIL